MKKTAKDLQSQLKVFNNYVSVLSDLDGCIKSLKQLVKELRSYLRKLDYNKYETIIEYLQHVDVNVRGSIMDFGTNDFCRFIRSKQEINFVLKNIIKDIENETVRLKIATYEHLKTA